MASSSRAPAVVLDRVTKVTTWNVAGLSLATGVAAALVAAVVARSLAGADAGQMSAGGRTAIEAMAARATAAIPEVPWLADRGDGRWVHGRGTTTTPSVLPAGETGLAVDAAHVASTLPGADGRSTIRIRARETGRPIVDVDAPMWVSAGAFTTAGLVVTGYPDASMGSDGGLVLVTVPDGAPTALVDARPFAAALGTPVARGGVLVSPSGRLVASNVCGLRLCETQVVDLATRDVWQPLHDAEGFLRVLTDDAIVTTDGDYRWVSARDVRDGRERWRAADSILLDPLAAADGSVVAVVGSRATGFGVAAFDQAGRKRELGVGGGSDIAWPRIWTEVSTPTTIVVGREGFREAIAGTGSRPVSVLDIGRAPAAVATTFQLPNDAAWSAR